MRRPKHPWLISWGTAASIVAVVAGIWGAMQWIDGHWARTADFERHVVAEEKRNSEQDIASARIELRQQLNYWRLRSVFVEDRVYDLAARKQTQGKKFPVADEVALQRYTKVLEQATVRANDIQRKIEAIPR